MKKAFTNFSFFLILILVVSSATDFFAQQLDDPLGKANQKEKTLNELSEEFNRIWDGKNVVNGYYFENGKKTKAPGWKLFKREEYYWEQRVDIKTGEFPTTNAAFEYEKVKHRLKKADFTSSWTNLGTNSSSGGYAGIGRINCVAFHPSNATTIWVGSPSGGLWMTSNGGTSWAIKNSSLPVLGVSDIAVPSDFSTSNTMYIATGDRDGGSMSALGGGQGADNVSMGVYKSTDGGNSWSLTGLTAAMTGTKIYRLLVHPTSTNILIASTTNGIYKSTNSGSTWIQTNPNRITDMEFKPGDPSIIYGTTTGYQSSPGVWDVYFFKSINTGDSFPSISIPGTSNGAYRGEVAVSGTSIYLLLALVPDGGATSGGLAGVYKSTDEGVSFSRVDPGTKSMLGYYSDGSGSNSGQGSYDLCIAANPTNANEVFIGGVNTWSSADGGSTWTINNMWTSGSSYNKVGAPEVHADKHALAYQSAGVLFEGNDGGIYKTTNGGTTWTDLSNGLVISQIYRIGVSQTSASTILTGLQDNGSKLYNSTWQDVKGGDGMECIIDYSNSNYMYATYVRGQISRSTLGGADFFPSDISANIPGGQPTGAWVTPYLIDPNSSTTLFAGYDKVWKTTDRGNSWTAVSDVLSGTTKLRSLAIAPSNSLVLYTADQTNMWKTTDGGTTTAWTPITLPTLPTSSITYIAVHPTNPDIVWITYGGYQAGEKVYESTDGGLSWTNISGALPNLPIMSIVHYKKATDRNVLFVGTDLGVYVSEQALPAPPTTLSKVNASDWAQYNSGLPNVVVSELEIFYAASGPDKLRAGTYGRGLWETDIDAALPVELTSFTVNSVEGNRVSLQWETATEVNNYGFEIERQNSNKINKLSELNADDWKSIGFIEGHGNSNSTKLYSFIDESVSGGSNFVYRLKQIDIDGKYEYSDLVEIKVVPVNFELTQNYPNPFNPTTIIKYSVPMKSQISLTIFDLLGREISKLVNGVQETGVYEASFDASKLSSGIYYYTLSAGDFTQTKKMMLVK
jgi:photosystem II stability/assembly factor-like uncharacterized protein